MHPPPRYPTPPQHPLRAPVTTTAGLLAPRRVNITLGPREERILITGLHTVADIYCTCCNTVLGWKYVSDGWTVDRPEPWCCPSLGRWQWPAPSPAVGSVQAWAGSM